MSFAADGSVSGSSGCNRFQTSATFDGTGLVFAAPVAMTRMACQSDALTAQENLILALLEGRTVIGFNPFSGEIVIARGDLSLLLVPAVSEDPSGMRPHAGLDRPAGDPPYLGVFGRADPLDIRAEPLASAPALAGVQSGTVLRNAGCSDHGGVRWCEVAPLSGEPKGWALADFLEPASPALRAGQGAFDATGVVPCAKESSVPTGPCPLGVVRSASGSAVVVVRRHDGMERVLYFENGAFTGADTSQVGGGFDTSFSREADLSLIRIDDERYEIPDAFIFGG